MTFVWRTARSVDLAQCLEIAADRFLYDERSLVALKAMWSEVLVRDIGRASVVVMDCARERILGFGISAFVSPALFGSIIGDGEPFVTRQLLERWRIGDPPFLHETGIATANATRGVNVFVMNSGATCTGVECSEERLFQLLADAFFAQHAGLNISGLAHECFGSFHESCSELGMRTRFYAHDATRVQSIPGDRRPCISWMTREEALRPPRCAVDQVFTLATKPQLNLDAGVRRVLRLALEGESDEYIADAVELSVATIKKRWLQIYETFRSSTGLVAYQWPKDRTLGDGRGPEMRRHVLRYIREHPEELHACELPSGKSPIRSYSG